MKCTVRFLTRKSRGGTAIKEQEVESDVLLIGRGNDCGIHLPDPRVLLHHAEVTVRSGEVYVAAQPGADVRVNGNLVQMTRVGLNEKINVGPYELIIEENDKAGKIAVSVELVQPLGDDLDRILVQSSVRTGRISMRKLSWAFALIAALAFFVAPWVASWFHETPALRMVLNTRDREVPPAATTMWTTGHLSSSHRFFGDACETCHTTPFIQVKDETCMTCHEGIEHHADPQKFTFASFEDKSCQNCHKEHQGEQSVTLSNQAFCADCHQDLHERSTVTTLRPVSDFGVDHPDFRPTVVLDSALHTVDRSIDMSAMPPPREDSSLNFPHNRHLRTTGVRDPVRNENVVMICADCHVTDGGGGYMLPIAFEKHCHQCHALKFDVHLPDRELMHGKPEEMFKQVRDIYDAVGMRGGYEEPEAPALIRRRPGTQLTTAQKKQVLDWSAEKTLAVLNGRTGRGLCEGCHKTFNTVASDGPTGTKWGVEPVSAANVWFPKSVFQHSSHRDMECGSCHEAKNSVESADVLMPTIATCRACHGGETVANKVPSTCMTCHDFHREDLGPMKVSPHTTTRSAPAQTPRPQPVQPPSPAQTPPVKTTHLTHDLMTVALAAFQNTPGQSTTAVSP